MSQVMKAFTGVFMILYLMVTSTGVLAAFYQVQYAQNMYAVMMDEIENSNYARPVLASCFETAEAAGYCLEMSLYSEEGVVTDITSDSDLPANTSQICMAEVVLNYSVKVAFFDINVEKQLCGYAR